jgi:peroxiredoxin Q/BCP
MFSFWKRKPKLLAVGASAPEFRVPDQDGRMVSLSDFRGRRVLLWFYPKASTPG